MRSDHNLSRVVPSGLSVTGWCARTDVDGRFKVHVDVVFSTGKFGGDPTDLIEFELNLRRAQIVVVPGDNTSFRVSSINRGEADPVGRESLTVSSRKKGEVAASLALKADLANPVSASAEASGSAAVEVERRVQIEKSVKQFIVQHMMTDEGFPSWEVRPNSGAFLQGTPWEAHSDPRVEVDFRGSPISLEPSVRVEIRCRGEDLDFGAGIEVKQKVKSAAFWRKPSRDVNRAAAEQFLKGVLSKKGLSFGGVGQKFGSLTIADVVLTVE